MMLALVTVAAATRLRLAGATIASGATVDDPDANDWLVVNQVTVIDGAMRSFA